MANSFTAHSVELRRNTQKKRRQRIIEEGGKELKVLIEKESNEKLSYLLDTTGRTQVDLICYLINQEFRRCKHG